MRIFGFMLFSLLMGLIVSAEPAWKPDFFASSHSYNSEPFAWDLRIHPSAQHHFNIKAPIHVSNGFKVQFKTESEITFKVVDAKLNEQSQVTVSAYLCDDAKSYCVKKERSFQLGEILDKSNPISRAIQATARRVKNAGKLDQQKKEVVATAPIKRKKDRMGFWDNAIADAIQEAQTQNKPLLIDFYGIWCPPCNQYIEQVFPSKAFRDEAKNYVLLKVDADRKESFALKSRFKVGGYPTLVFARLSDDVTKIDLHHFLQLQEIDRIVGFMHAFDMAARMKKNFEHRKFTLEERFRAATGKPEHMDLLRTFVTQLAEQGERQKISLTLEEALREDEFKPYEQELQFLLQTYTRGVGTTLSSEHMKVIQEYSTGIEKRSSHDLLRLHEWGLDFIQSGKVAEGKKLAIAVYAELKNRINPKTHWISGIELSEADLASLRLSLADALSDSSMQRDARQQMIAAYQQMLTEMNSKPDSTDVRSIHLELAALYRLEGDYEKSNSIYQRFIKKYPREFTFYLGASKLRVAEKKWDEAIQYAEKAVRYSYGDNQIRSVLQLAVAQDQAGKVSDAKQTLTKFLNNYQAPQDDLQVRSKRYLTEVSNFLKHLQEKKP